LTFSHNQSLFQKNGLPTKKSPKTISKSFRMKKKFNRTKTFPDSTQLKKPQKANVEVIQN
jgi:hypothetical protein